MPEEDFIAVLRQSRWVGAAALLALLWTIESIAPMFERRQRRLSHNAANLGLALINALVSFVAVLGILFVTEYSEEHDIGLLHRVDLPEWLHWVAAIVLVDCWQYWWHRINHHVGFLWRFHAVHHSDADLDVSSGVRFHTVEIILSMIARLAVLPLIGVTIPQLLVYEVASLPIILFHHSNIRLPNKFDVLLRWLIVTPWMHWVHHSRWQPETDSNYSSFLSVWDRIFGSFRLREEPWKIELGLDNWKEREWRGIWGMLSKPFRKGSGRERNSDSKEQT